MCPSYRNQSVDLLCKSNHWFVMMRTLVVKGLIVKNSNHLFRNLISLAVYWLDLNPANIYLFKVNNRNTRKRCEIFSKLTVKIP